MEPNDPLDRRDFLKRASATGLGAVVASHGIGPLFTFDGSPAEKMAVGIMGLNGRGMVHARDFAHGANTTVAYLCDVDSTVLAKALAETSPLQARPPKAVGDFRRMLDDKSVDARPCHERARIRTHDIAEYAPVRTEPDAGSPVVRPQGKLGTCACHRPGT